MNKTMNFPGPGNYDTQRGFAKTKQYYQQISMRGKNVLRNLNLSPGPIYNTIDSSSATKKREPAFKIGTDSKIGLDKRSSKESPGPGAYNPIM